MSNTPYIELQRQKLSNGKWEGMSRDYDEPIMLSRYQYVIEQTESKFNANWTGYTAVRLFDLANSVVMSEKVFESVSQSAVAQGEVSEEAEANQPEQSAAPAKKRGRPKKVVDNNAE
jgi:hypothetical protein